MTRGESFRKQMQDRCGVDLARKHAAWLNERRNHKGGNPDKLQIHEMKVENGVMQMREITGGLPVPANGSVVLKPGSYHVMLIGLKKPLTAGETFPLTLTFAKAGNISVTVPVQSMGATQDKGGNMGGMGNSGSGMGHMEMK